MFFPFKDERLSPEVHSPFGPDAHDRDQLVRLAERPHHGDDSRDRDEPDPDPESSRDRDIPDPEASRDPEQRDVRVG